MSHFWKAVFRKLGVGSPASFAYHSQTDAHSVIGETDSLSNPRSEIAEKPKQMGQVSRLEPEVASRVIALAERLGTSMIIT